jgi:hypothetical protein
MAIQGELKYSLTAEDISDEMILKRCGTSTRKALRLCVDCSPKDDKEIIAELKQKTGYEYQLSHFSEGLNGGKKNIDPDHIPVIEEICGNWIPTRFLVITKQHEMKPKKAALELENERLRKALDDERKRNETIVEFLKGIRIG